jgi:hypothetical protein
MEVNWLEDSSSREWAQNRLPMIPAPALKSSERRTMEDAIEKDVQRIRELEQKVALDRTVLSYIRLLPNEVLATVFKHVLACPLEPDEEPRRLDFLLVCRTWRNIAFNNPKCWTTLIMNIDYSYDKDPKDNKGYVSLSTRIRLTHKYTKGLPVDFTISLVTGKCDPLGEDCLENQLANEFSRWPLTLRSYSEHFLSSCMNEGRSLSNIFLELLPRIEPGAYTQVTELFLNYARESDESEGTLATFFFPDLRHLHIVFLEEIGVLARFSSPKLQTLTIEDVIYWKTFLHQPGILMRNLVRFPDLEQLTFFATNRVAVELIEQIQLPKMAQLTVGYKNLSQTFKLRPFLNVFPCIENLSIFAPGLWDVDRLFELPSIHCIRHLTLVYRHSKDLPIADQAYHGFAEIVRSCPNLTELNIASDHRGSKIQCRHPFDTRRVYSTHLAEFPSNKFFMDITSRLSQVDSTLPKFGAKIRHLRLTFVVIDLPSLARISKFTGGTAEHPGSRCLITTRKCIWYKSEQKDLISWDFQRFVPHPVPDVTDMDLYQFIELAILEIE